MFVPTLLKTRRIEHFHLFLRLAISYNACTSYVYLYEIFEVLTDFCHYNYPSLYQLVDFCNFSSFELIANKNVIRIYSLYNIPKKKELKEDKCICFIDVTKNSLKLVELSEGISNSNLSDEVITAGIRDIHEIDLKSSIEND